VENTTMTRRPGLTLTEVLVTLAILAFGILAILTMFPLAASQMAIAVREDRSAQGAAAADGYFRSVWKSQVVEQGGGSENFYSALDNPNAYNPAFTAAQTHGGPFPAPNPDELSYPVAIDPMGFEARTTGIPYWVGDTGANGVASDVPRRTLALLGGNKQYSFRICSLMDGLGYDEDGQPQTDRELRYNWLWVIQRQQNANKFCAAMTVVVFDNRPHLFAPTGAEDTYYKNVSFTTGSTSVTIPGTPDLKPGGWVMDATVDAFPQVFPPPPAAPAPQPTKIPVRNANFYQITSVAAGGGSTTLELQSPIKPVNTRIGGSYTGTLVVLKGVSGVYTRPMLTAD